MNVTWDRRTPCARRTDLWNAPQVAAAVALLALVGSCKKPAEEPPAGASSPAERPNVLLITFDTTRFDRLSCYGYGGIQTESVDALARRGIRYTRCYSVAPITLPSHTSIMTGLYPFHHQLRDNGTGPLDERAVTLAEVLKGQGYQTGAIIGAFVLDGRFGLNQGFDHYDDAMPESEPGVVSYHFPERDARAVTDAALAWLERIESPYFLWVHYFDPHQPYAAPGMPAGSKMQQAYDLEIGYADRHLGRLLERVDAIERSSGRDTLTIFTADHGEALYDHGEETHAFFVYNETVQVPLIVDLPGTDQKGVTIDAPVSLVDLAPSVLAWLDVDPPYEWHGRRLPTDPGDEPSERRPLYFETHVPFNTYRWSPLEGVVVDNLKYIHAPRPEFYDLATDPGESKNLFADRRSRAEAFEQAMTTLRTSRLDAPSFDPVGRFAETETLSALRALGYVGAESSPPPIEIEGLVDPKDRVSVHVKLSNLHGALEFQDTSRVVSTLSEVLTTDPGNIEALRQLAQQLEDVRSGQAYIALGLEQAALELPEPYGMRVPIALVGALVRAQQGDRAKEVASTFVARHPESAEALNVLAAALLAVGDVARAEQSAQKALTLDPEFSAAALTLGEIALAGGRFDEAIALFEKSMTADSMDAPTLVKIGDAHVRAGRIDQAAESYRAAIDRNDQLVDAYVALAETHGARAEWNEAVKRLRQAVTLDPDHAAAQYSLGVALMKGRGPSEAVIAFEQALRLDPNNGQAAINLGIALFSSGRTDEAIETLRRATTLKSVAPDAHFNLATAYAQNGDNQSALVEFERALELRPSYAEPVNQLAGFYLSSGRAADAVRVLGVGVEHHDDNVVFHNTLAMVLATSRDDNVRNGDKAVRHARRADELTGHQHVEVLGTLASALAEQGDFPNAQVAVRKAIDLARAANRVKLADQLSGQLELYLAGKAMRDPRF